MSENICDRCKLNLGSNYLRLYEFHIDSELVKTSPRQFTYCGLVCLREAIE
jgi:hypothetical protein